jgi:hypothetical protein
MADMYLYGLDIIHDHMSKRCPGQQHRKQDIDQQLFLSPAVMYFVMSKAKQE